MIDIVAYPLLLDCVIMPLNPEQITGIKLIRYSDLYNLRTGFMEVSVDMVSCEVTNAIAVSRRL